MGISFIYPQYLWLLLIIPLTAALGLFGRRGLPPLRLWGGLGLRSLLLLLIVLALAGIQLRLPSSTLSVVFVLDVSDSITPAEQSRGEELIRQSIQKMPAGDRAAIVVFGEDALVERLASEDSSLAKLTSTPITTRTDIASALQLAMALFPDEGARRLVLISDGRENLSTAMKQAELAAMQQVELQYMPLGEASDQVEVQVSNLDAPASARQGQEIDLGINIDSTAAVGATLRVFADERLIHSQEISLKPGTNRYQVPVTSLEPGFHRFRTQIEPDADHRLQNNEASAFTVVKGPPSILLVEGTPDEGENLTATLKAASMDVTVIAPTAIPSTLPELARYDAVILANVPASSLPSGVMDTLPVYVRDLGKGLLMIGGDNTFGAGGYLRTPIEEAMPVYMDVKSRELAANLALVVAVDKSGSMGRCHCDNPDLNQSYTPVQSGQPKVDIAKEAIMRAASALGSQDFLGVVTFDSKARWALQPQLLPGQNALENAIGTFQAEGQTNMFTGVDEAYKAIEGINAKRKHVILLTDGWVRTGDLTRLAQEMREKGVTLSVIAAGGGSAEYLKALAESGGGRYYPATDMMSVPDIFLKETVKSVGQYIIEEPFYPLADSPSPVFRGIDVNDLPPLLGYNGTSPKNNTHTFLLTPRGDPLLVSWQYGLGKAAAWTSDMKGRWGTDWVKWSQFARFSSQLMSWLLPTPQVEGLDAGVSISDRGTAITLTARDKEGRPVNNLKIQAKLINPALKTDEISFTQVGSGQYQVTTRSDQPGAYLAELGIFNDKNEPFGHLTLGYVIPYSPEYRSGNANLGLLGELARVTGGGILEEPLNAFLHNLPALQSAREIWQPLLLMAALLFPIDVALRRLVISRRDLQFALSWIARQTYDRKSITRERAEPLLGQLYSARERARARTRHAAVQEQPKPDSGAKSSTELPVAESAPSAPETGPEAKKASGDSFSRLREAKKRARGRDR